MNNGRLETSESRIATPAALLVAVLAASQSWAGQAPQLEGSSPVSTYAFDVGIGRSDNLTRVPDNEIAENIGTAGLQFSLDRAGSRLDVEANANLRYFDYVDDTYDDELTGRFDGLVAYGLIPGRLNWVIDDSYGQSLIDIFAVPTPANRESINYFSTGPDLLFSFGPNGFAKLFGRYAATSYEVTPLNGNRRQVGLAAGRSFPGSGTLSLNLVGERVAYDNAVSNPGYDREQAFVRYESRGGRTRLAIDAGYTRITDLAYTNGGGSFQIDFSRTISASSTLLFSSGIRLTDASDRFRIAEIGAISGAQTSVVSATPEVYENRFARLGWEFSRNRTSFGLSASFNDDVYDRSIALGRKRTIGEFNLRRQLNRTLSARVLGSYTLERREAVSSDFEEWRAGVGFHLTLGRRFFVNLDGDRFKRTADAAAREYSENRAFLTIGMESR